MMTVNRSSQLKRGQTPGTVVSVVPPRIVIILGESLQREEIGLSPLLEGRGLPIDRRLQLQVRQRCIQIVSGSTILSLYAHR